MTPPTIIQPELVPSVRAHNLLVGANVEIDETAEIGANVVIYDGVRIGAGVTIKNNCVIGERPTLAVDSNARPQLLERTTVEQSATICNGVVMFAGSSIGARTIIGDQALVREGAWVDEDCVIGRGCMVSAGTRVGARTKVQAQSVLLAGMTIEEDVRIGGGLIGTTNNTIGRDKLAGRKTVTVRRGARIGSAVCLFGGIEVGEEAFIGAGAVVRESVAPYAKVAGVPARVIGTVSDV